MRWLLLLGVMLGCGTTKHLGKPIEYRIDHSLMYATHREWRGSKFYRVSLDTIMVGPVFVVVNTLGYGCVVAGSVWALNPPYLACSRWRSPR